MNKTKNLLVAYRRNVLFKSVLLKESQGDEKYSEVGELKILLDEKKYIEGDKVVMENLIKSKYLGDELPKLMQLIHEKRLYVRHIPDSSRDMRNITTARFILTLAAFEWEVQEV